MLLGHDGWVVVVVEEEVVVDVDVVETFVVEAIPLVDVTGVLGGSTVG